MFSDPTVFSVLPRSLIVANYQSGSGKTTLISLITSDHPQTYSLPVTLFGRSRLPQPGQLGISIFDIQSRIGHSSPEVHTFFPKYLTVRRTLESAWADTPLTKPKMSYEVDDKVTAALNWFRGELNPSLGPTESERFDTTNRLYQKNQQLGQLANMTRVLAEEEGDPNGADWADQMKFGELNFSAQRVALFIRAVIRNPDLVVLDEAFSGMDDAARDKCHLFLSSGQNASFRFKSTAFGSKALTRRPAVQESYHSRLGMVKIHGLQDHQALIVISHKKEEVPGSVRNWICLAQPGQGPPRVGELLMPLELKVGGWDEIWGTKILPLRTAMDEGLKRNRKRASETPEEKALRLAHDREVYRAKRNREKDQLQRQKQQHADEQRPQRQKRLVSDPKSQGERFAYTATEAKRSWKERNCGSSRRLMKPITKQTLQKCWQTERNEIDLAICPCL